MKIQDVERQLETKLQLTEFGAKLIFLSLQSLIFTW